MQHLFDSPLSHMSEYTERHTTSQLRKMLRFGLHGSSGLKILHFVCTVFGFWIPLRPLSGKKKFFVKLFSTTLTMAFVCQSVFSLHMALCFTVDSYITGVIYAVNIITVLKHLFCLVYFEMRKSQLAHIYNEIQVILERYNYPFVDLRPTCRKVTVRSVAAYFCVPAAFIVLMRGSSISSVGAYLNNPAAANATLGALPAGLNETLSTVRKDFSRFFHLHSENVFRAAMLVSTMSNLRVIATHALLLTSYLLVAEQLQVLALCLANILYSHQKQRVLFVKVSNDELAVEFGNDGGSLAAWQEFQQHLARILDKINNFASPVTVISICCYVALLTLSAFAVTKLLSDLIYATNFMTGCLLYLIEIYLCCEVGHKIKKQADALADVIHHGRWLSLDAKLVNTLHFLAVDCQRSFLAKGGPFFTLSLEFFATVVSAVFTYFIVAIQIK